MGKLACMIVSTVLLAPGLAAGQQLVTADGFASVPWQSDLDVIRTHWGTSDQTASVLDGQYTLVFYQVAFESTDPTLLTFMLDSRDELVAGVIAAEVQDRVQLPAVREKWIRVITSSWGESAGGCSNDACNMDLPRGSEFEWIPFCQGWCEEPEAQLMIMSSDDRAEIAFMVLNQDFSRDPDSQPAAYELGQALCIFYTCTQ